MAALGAWVRASVLAVTGVVVLAATISAAGCATVRFNEKQRLGAAAMRFDGDGLTAKVRGDVLSAREGSIGGFHAGGAGGCGCN